MQSAMHKDGQPVKSGTYITNQNKKTSARRGGAGGRGPSDGMRMGEVDLIIVA